MICSPGRVANRGATAGASAPRRFVVLASGHGPVGGVRASETTPTACGRGLPRRDREGRPRLWAGRQRDQGDRAIERYGPLAGRGSRVPHDDDFHCTDCVGRMCHESRRRDHDESNCPSVEAIRKDRRRLVLSLVRPFVALLGVHISISMLMWPYQASKIGGTAPLKSSNKRHSNNYP